MLLSQSSNVAESTKLYWIDHTENYYRTLQLAIKYDGVEHILHDYSDWTIPTITIAVNGPSGRGLGGNSGSVKIGDQHFKYDNKWTSKTYIESYLRNTYMPEHNMTKLNYSGTIIPPPLGGDVAISGIVER